jgi:hypothetical protein
MQYVISTGAVAHLDYDDRMESACDRMMPVFLSSLMCWQRAAAVLEVYLSAELSAASRLLRMRAVWHVRRSRVSCTSSHMQRCVLHNTQSGLITKLEAPGWVGQAGAAQSRFGWNHCWSRGAGSYIVLLALWLARLAPLHFAWRVLHEHEHQIEAQNIEIVTLHY